MLGFVTIGWKSLIELVLIGMAAGSKSRKPCMANFEIVGILYE